MKQFFLGIATDHSDDDDRLRAGVSAEFEFTDHARTECAVTGARADPTDARSRDEPEYAIANTNSATDRKEAEGLRRIARRQLRAAREA